MGFGRGGSSRSGDFFATEMPVEAEAQPPGEDRRQEEHCGEKVDDRGEFDCVAAGGQLVSG